MESHYLGLQEQSDSQLQSNESGTIWSTSAESDSGINLCTEADSGSTSSTHEDCEKNEAFIFEEQLACTNNNLSKEAHEECGKNMASTEEKTDCTENVSVVSKESHEDCGKNIASTEEEPDCTENVLVVSKESHEDCGKNIVTNEGEPTSITHEDQAIKTTQEGEHGSLKNEVIATVQEELTQEGEHSGLKNEVTMTSQEFARSIVVAHIHEPNCTETEHTSNNMSTKTTHIQEMSDNFSIDSTFVDVCTSIAVAENTVALSSLPLVQGARTSTPVSDASDDEVPLSKLIPKGFKIKKNVKSQKTGTNNKRITRSAKL